MFVDDTWALFAFSFILFNWQYSYFRPCQCWVVSFSKGYRKQNETLETEHNCAKGPYICILF